MSRPRKHDRPKIMRAVCERISNGELVLDAARAEGTTARRIREWAEADKELAPLYMHARVAQAHAIAEDALSIADDTTGDPARDRLRVDTRKWLASKIAPRIYGEKLDMTSGGERIGGVIVLPAETVDMQEGVKKDGKTLPISA